MDTNIRNANIKVNRIANIYSFIFTVKYKTASDQPIMRTYSIKEIIMRTRSMLAIAALTLSLTACASGQVKRTPDIGTESVASVGDAVYAFASTDPKKHSLAQIAAGPDSGDRWELLYSGVSDGKINFIYREFAANLAREAFTQDAQYDYTPGDVISFKGAQIRIIEAGSSGITYVVEGGFNFEGG